MAVAAGTAAASGHGPVFGGATPTLGKGGWSFDQAWMGRRDRTGDDEQMLRSMIGYGITEDLQISASLPIELTSTGRMPMGRMTAMMSGNREVEALVGWRFHRRPVGEGARARVDRRMSAATVPLESRRAGIRTAPSAYVSAATGYASRAHYFWVGGRLPAPARATAATGSATSSRTASSTATVRRRCGSTIRSRTCASSSKRSARSPARARHGGVDDGRHRWSRRCSSGPTALLLYKAYGISGGVLFPVYQRTNGATPGAVPLRRQFQLFLLVELGEPS